MEHSNVLKKLTKKKDEIIEEINDDIMKEEEENKIVSEDKNRNDLISKFEVLKNFKKFNFLLIKYISVLSIKKSFRKIEIWKVSKFKKIMKNIRI